MTLLFRHFHHSLQSPIAVTGVRTFADETHALLGSRTMPASTIAVRREGGAWKIGKLLGSPLPGSTHMNLDKEEPGPVREFLIALPTIVLVVLGIASCGGASRATHTASALAREPPPDDDRGYDRPSKSEEDDNASLHFGRPADAADRAYGHGSRPSLLPSARRARRRDRLLADLLGHRGGDNRKSRSAARPTVPAWGDLSRGRLEVVQAAPYEDGCRCREAEGHRCASRWRSGGRAVEAGRGTTRTLHLIAPRTEGLEARDCFSPSTP